jgi:hypothetical protein
MWYTPKETVYSESLNIDPDPLGTALANATKMKDKVYFKREECNDPEWEGEWERTQRMRKENHPLMQGGRNNGVKLMPTYHFRHKEKFSQRKFHILSNEWDK